MRTCVVGLRDLLHLPAGSGGEKFDQRALTGASALKRNRKSMFRILEKLNACISA